MPTAHGNTKEVSVEDFLDIFNHRGPNRPVLTFAEIKDEIIKRKGTMSEPTVRGKVKPHVYDPDVNPSGFIMRSESDSITTYWLKGEKMVLVDLEKKTFFELIAMSEQLLPLIKKITLLWIVLSLSLRSSQFLLTTFTSKGQLAQDLGIFEILTLHPLYIAWTGGMFAGLSLLADYSGRTRLLTIPLGEQLEAEYQAIPKNQYKKRITQLMKGGLKLVRIDVEHLFQIRYLPWGVYTIVLTGFLMSVNPWGQLIQDPSSGFWFGVGYGAYIVVMGIMAAVIFSSGVGAYFEARTWLKRRGGVS